MIVYDIDNADDDDARNGASATGTDGRPMFESANKEPRFDSVSLTSLNSTQSSAGSVSGEVSQPRSRARDLKIRPHQTDSMRVVTSIMDHVSKP